MNNEILTNINNLSFAKTCDRSDYQHKLFLYILENSLEELKGKSLVEIGSYKGNTTNLLCDFGKKHGTTVHNIDPWINHGGSPEVYQSFIENTRHQTNLHTHKVSSTSEEAKNVFKENDFYFAYLDGCHMYDYCKSDIALVDTYCKSGTIACVDDYNIPDIKQAIRDCMKTFDIIPVDIYPEDYHKEFIFIRKK